MAAHGAAPPRREDEARNHSLTLRIKLPTWSSGVERMKSLEDVGDEATAEDVERTELLEGLTCGGTVFAFSAIARFWAIRKMVFS